jgi:hypothetical protein
MESMLYREHGFLCGIKHFGWPSDLEDKPHSGRPCTSKTEENMTNVRTLMKSDQCLTVRMIGSELNFNHQTIFDILTKELGMQTLGCCIMTMLPVNTPISVKEFDQKGYSSGSEAPILA